MLRGAVERHLEVIGEAAGRVSIEFRKTHSEIPWSRIVGQRNVLIHEYGEIDDALVWEGGSRPHAGLNYETGATSTTPAI